MTPYDILPGTEMLSKEQNERITKTGPDAPMGKLLRRYWQPVGVSDEVTTRGQPKPVKVLSEELVLFRDEFGQPALMGRRCPHRLTSLAYGRVEDGGIRCPFHGWLFDRTGTCLQQPAEPLGSTFKDKVRQTAYPCRDLGGLIFAYMGPPANEPLLPNYEVLVRQDGTRAMDVYTAGGNYLQHVEGAIDTSHLSYLHATNWSKVKHQLFAMPKPVLEHRETDYGLWQKSLLPNITGYGVTADPVLLYTYFIMPAGFLRVQESVPGTGLVQKIQSWYVPIDDDNTVRYQVAFSPPLADGTPYEWSHERTEPPSAANDYFRDYGRVDTISGIPVDAHRTPIQPEISYTPQDMMANEEQGSVCDRSHEHLGANDAIVTAMRRMYFDAMDAVAAGHDPLHILRDPHENELVRIAGHERGELV
jgi:phenylpropionate dioxygenase-like ring-hydroxylating dioxygenase large terminal subunit